MGVPIATGQQWADQLTATSAVVAEVEIAASRLSSSDPTVRAWQIWRTGWQSYADGARIPPIMPLPPPLPSIWVRPDAWSTLQGWDAAARRWAQKIGAIGGQVGELPPPTTDVTIIDPSALGLGIGSGLSLGLVAAIVAAALFLFRK